jgi:hypothetical protein
MPVSFDLGVRPVRSRLIAISPSIPDLVSGAGGWLFDQVTMGWTARVLTADLSDPRPLHILGARHHDLRSALDQPLRAWFPQAISVQASLYHADTAIREFVAQARDEGLREVILWDPAAPLAAGGDATLARHELSAAARAFKAHALAASQACQPHRDGARQGDVSCGTETFLRIGIPYRRRR